MNGSSNLYDLCKRLVNSGIDITCPDKITLSNNEANTKKYIIFLNYYSPYYCLSFKTDVKVVSTLEELVNEIISVLSYIYSRYYLTFDDVLNNKSHNEEDYFHLKDKCYSDGLQEIMTYYNWNKESHYSLTVNDLTIDEFNTMHEALLERINSEKDKYKIN